jgi:hypothetical protein
MPDVTRNLEQSTGAMTFQPPSRYALALIALTAALALTASFAAGQYDVPTPSMADAGTALSPVTRIVPADPPAFR